MCAASELQGLPDLQPGHHLCCLYASEGEHRSILTPFLRQGLERGEKVLYVVDAHTAEAVLGYLRDDGVDPQPHLASGQLAILTRQETYLREGAFAPDRMIALLRGATEEAVAEGYPALRATGEMTWALRGLPGSERLLEYEARLNDFFPGSRCLALCQYDSRRFDPALLLDVLFTHPIVLVGGRLCHNPYYLPPAVFLNDLPAARLQQWTRALLEQQRAEERLSRSERLLRTIFEINQLMVRESDEQQLLAETCRIAVEHGGFRMAWIGLADWEAKRVRPVAAAGVELGYLDTVDIRLDGSERSRGPTGRAILEGHTVAVEDTETDPNFAPWREAARERGYRSSAALPMRLGGRIIGTLNLYAAESRVFSGETVHLLENLAADLGFALQAIEVARGREAVEESLRASEARYRFLFERNVAGVFRSMLDGRLLECNGALARMLGYAFPTEMLASSAWELYPSREARNAFLAAIREQGLVQNYEHVLRRRDGTTIWVLENASLAPDETGALTIIEGTLIDITERRRLEEQLREAQRMEAVGRLAGGVAHDFNNLLQAMLSQTQLLRDHLGDPARAVEVAEELEQQVKRGASLTRQLLLFSRREAPEPERVDLNEVLHGALQMLRRLVRENIEFVVRPAERALPVVGDRGQLDQVLMNLVVNASDAMPEGGRLTISAGVEDRLWAWFEVSDTGHGIPEEIRARIFEPFFTTKEAGLGTGLGLSVVHGIVSQHGGRIDVTSRVGEGTTFRVTLPRLASGEYVPVPEGALEPAALAEGKGERVLVVEDEQAAREGLREILTGLGYRVTAVASGEEAGKLPAAPAFDVLLTDLLLPGVAGPELARGLRERWHGLKVILMSGYTEDEALRRRIASGEVRFLQKPFGMATLARELRAALDEKR